MNIFVIINIVLAFIIIGLIIALLVVKRKKIIIETQEKEKLLQEIQKLEQTKTEFQKETQNISNKLKIQYDEKDKLISELNNLTVKCNTQKINVDGLIVQQKQIKDNIEDLQKTAGVIYDTALKDAQDKFDIQIEKVSENFQKQKEEYQNEYVKTLEEFSKDLSQKIQEGHEQLENLMEQLNKLKSSVQAAIEEQKRQESNKEKQEFYQLQISELDLKEIQKIRDILSYMRNERPLCKAIWESYYRTPCNELLARIIENKQKSGIYKITNLLNSKSYIGQATNLSERLKTHIKAGLGIDTPNSILYKAMKHDGVENFSFEVMEYCDQKNLNQKEKFWIDYFSSQDWGYNMTSGGSRNV